MASLTKKQIWANVQEQVGELLSGSKVSKKFSEELLLLLESNLAPKAGGGSSINPPKEIDGVMNYWCRFHARYEPVGDMVMSAGKSKGYCKASISLWNKTNSEIKRMNSMVSDLMVDGYSDEAQVYAIEARELKSVFNKPEFYDYGRDWAEFYA